MDHTMTHGMSETVLNKKKNDQFGAQNSKHIVLECNFRKFEGKR